MSTVSIRKTTGDEYAAIKAAVDQVIADIGGIEDIIKPGYKVIIKPNLVACPTDRLSGGVTRWEVCLAIYEAVKAIGAGFASGQETLQYYASWGGIYPFVLPALTPN